jgi:aspartyl-tRNA(Asn)/glutamyl-tRNA(Gln) amidotransferase subunit C
MKLSKEEVEHIATLARLNLTEEEKEKYSEQLSGILSYFEKLKEVDTSAVEPTSQVTGLTNIMREDEIGEFDAASELVSIAPAEENGFYKVPKILEKK